MLIPTKHFCQIVDIGFDRFEQRRLRERSAGDVAQSLGQDDDVGLMPIAPTEFGQRAFYDLFDTVRLRAAVQLERCGLSFGAACRFIRGAGLAPDFLHVTGPDVFAAQWLLPDGQVRRICGEAQDLRRAMPEAPLSAVRINVSAVRDDVGSRAATLGLKVIHGQFEEAVS